ncbi:NADP-dependent oxidoreductase domain-containing protein [Mycena galopus ATCC 62051]|nr:NADP-dependent oxidoreductase domain-containing protein [Mycena galopus ATCC 62051]
MEDFRFDGGGSNGVDDEASESDTSEVKSCGLSFSSWPSSSPPSSMIASLRLKYVDLYLIHSPRTLPDVDGVWKECEKIQKDGLTKSIGLSNFTLEALQSLVKKAQVWPAVNQVEFHPYNYAQNKVLLEWSTKHGIVIEGYSSLSSITKFPGAPSMRPWRRLPHAWAFLRLRSCCLGCGTTSIKGRLEEYLAVGDLPSRSVSCSFARKHMRKNTPI